MRAPADIAKHRRTRRGHALERTRQQDRESRPTPAAVRERILPFVMPSEFDVPVAAALTPRQLHRLMLS